MAKKEWPKVALISLVYRLGGFHLVGFPCGFLGYIFNVMDYNYYIY